jgi:hypothetical protein
MQAGHLVSFLVSSAFEVCLKHTAVSDAIFARELFALADRRPISATIVGNDEDDSSCLLKLYFTRSTVESSKNGVDEYTVQRSKGKNKLQRLSQANVSQSQDPEEEEEVPRQQNRPSREPKVGVLRFMYK